ncbi:ABC transporter permease [Clostridium sp.]|uniref:ABC transporter permease n=1 Tax=Clostridium sp. TaxID=1506 RepID=UPI002FDDD976
MKFKHAFRAVSRKSFFSLLLIIQLVFCFYSIYENLNLNEKISLETKKIERYFKNKKVYTLEAPNLFGRDVDMSELNKAFNKLYSNPNYEFFKIDIGSIAIKSFKDSEQFKAYDYQLKKGYFLAKNITIDKKYFKNYPIKLKYGRLFNDEEYKVNYKSDRIIPILVGSNYSKYFKVGDEIPIEISTGEGKGKIIGIIEENQYSPGDVTQPDSKYLNFNNYIITTELVFEEDYYKNLCAFNGNYIIFDNSIEEYKIQNYLNDIKETFNSIPHLNVGTRDLTKYIEAESTLFKEQREITFTTSISIIIFVCVTLIITLLNSINKRKKEFGIHIMCGGKLSDIAAITYLQILIVFISSYLISVAFIYSQYKTDINFHILGMEFTIMLFISVATSILPVIKIFNLNLSELIKGDE